MGAKHFEESDLNFPHLPEWKKHRSYPVVFLQEFHNIQGLSWSRNETNQDSKKLIILKES